MCRGAQHSEKWFILAEVQRTGSKPLPYILELPGRFCQLGKRGHNKVSTACTWKWDGLSTPINGLKVDYIDWVD